MGTNLKSRIFCLEPKNLRPRDTTGWKKVSQSSVFIPIHDSTIILEYFLKNLRGLSFCKYFSIFILTILSITIGEIHSWELNEFGNQESDMAHNQEPDSSQFKNHSGIIHQTNKMEE